ncbi:MAG: lipid-A-disaccharide synthase [Methylophilaceae bacterium]
MPKIAIVAGEASGDLLGAHLIAALKKQRKDLQFFGIAGPKMQREGASTLYAIEQLSVRGYVEVLKHLFGLLKLRRNLLKQILQEEPDVFIGIDAPDFNFWLERKLKKHGIPTIHYASPSIWAWRGGRIHKIKRAVSHMLALFPFEPAIYQKAGIPVTFVGHPLADDIPLKPNMKAARETLKLKQSSMVIAMLPGSRQSEVLQHADLFVKTAQLITQDNPNSVFLVPLITRATRNIFENALYKNQSQTTNIQVLFGHAHDAMEAADIVIVASGTATLEAALLKRPMLITYRMPTISWQILKRMNYLPYVGLPNVLAGKFLVPELLQKEATPEKLADALTQMLNNPVMIKEIKQEFTDIHQSLKQNAAKKAAEVVLSYIK